MTQDDTKTIRNTLDEIEVNLTIIVGGIGACIHPDNGYSSNELLRTIKKDVREEVTRLSVLRQWISEHETREDE
ncbi:MAG: hypothetical protein ACYS7Y_28685 [Planctomycetota bacterium]|jgi:hypothetical protein